MVQATRLALRYPRCPRSGSSFVLATVSNSAIGQILDSGRSDMASDPVTGRHEVEVAPQSEGERLDRWLAASLDGVSRSRLQSLLRGGAVSLDGATIGDPGRRVKPGETYLVVMPAAVPAEPMGERIPLAVVHEDDDLIVIDKPAGLVVHPAAGHETGTLVNALIAHCGDSLSGIGGVRRPGIVHRLDKDTSGLLVVAKTDAAHQSLASQFQAHGADGRLERRYLALIWGAPLRQQGTIDAPLARSRTSRTKIAVTRLELGRHAVTHYERLELFTGDREKALASLLELRLETGRTHQIRVHLAHIGHPVMGDPVYATGFKTSAGLLTATAADALAELDRQALHAAHLRFVHPTSDRPMTFDSPLPDDMTQLLNALRSRPSGSNRPARRIAVRKS